MINRLFFTTFFVVWLGCNNISMSYSDKIMSPVQILVNTMLINDIVLDNSSEIYLNAANFLNKPSTVKSPISDISSSTVCLAWASNPKADNQIYQITLHKNTSIFKAIEQIAKRRNEILVDKGNYIVIRPSNEEFVRTTNKVISTGTQSDLERQIDAAILTRISLIQPEGGTMEKFINAKLAESGRLFFKGKNTEPFTFKISEEAKSEIPKVNIIGNWTYRDLMEAICDLTGLRWLIDGKTLWLVENGVKR